MKKITVFLFRLALLHLLFNTSLGYAQIYPPYTHYVYNTSIRNLLQNSFPSCIDSTGVYADPNCPLLQTINDIIIDNMDINDIYNTSFDLVTLFPNLEKLIVYEFDNPYYIPYHPNLKELHINGFATIDTTFNPTRTYTIPSQMEIFSCINCFGIVTINLDSASNLKELLYWNSPIHLNNRLNNIGSFPNSLLKIDFANTIFSTLPQLPNNLKHFRLTHNNVPFTLPSLPLSLKTLDVCCNTNNLTTLPVLPSGLESFIANNTYISCYPPFPYSLIDSTSFNISSNNSFTCLPNYVPAMQNYLYNIPLCDGSNGCPISSFLIGSVLLDSNFNCIIDYSNDIFTKYVPVKLFDNSTFNQIAQTATAINGIYTFFDSLPSGSYLIEIDTLNKPYQVSCAGYGTTLPINYLLNSQIDSLDFLVNCKPGFDVGIQSVVSQGWVFPGQTHLVNVVAGDISQFYNLNCADGISGQLNISFTGPVTYAGVPSGTTFIPVVSGNNLTYTLTNWANVDVLNDIKFLLETDTSAQAGDLICINLSITPTSGDNVLSNNTYQFCYYVVNSYDPNRKDVYPEKVEYGYQDWITYTVYFQNTGNAPAFNIKLVDTLSTLLDHKTFELLSYSHNHRYDIKNGVLQFYFDHIMLPDSTTDPMGSIGFVQFRMKPQQAFDYNTIIENQVAIYFDYNSPILTNVAQTSTIQHASIEQHFIDNILIYPNPAEDFITIATGIVQESYSISIYDLSGRLVGAYKNLSGNQIIPLNDEWSGAYILKIHYDNGVENFRKLIIK